MNNELISFITAKLAKKKGFNLEVFLYYTTRGKLAPVNHRLFTIKEGSGLNADFNSFGKDYYTFEDKLQEHISAPTQSLLQKWLREEYEIIIECLTFDKGWLEKEKWCYQYHIHNKTDNPNEHYVSVKEYKTWELALEAGLYSGLKLIKNENK